MKDESIASDDEDEDDDEEEDVPPSDIDGEDENVDDEEGIVNGKAVKGERKEKFFAFKDSHSPQYLMQLNALLKANGPDVQLSSNNEDLQLAIEFSRSNLVSIFMLLILWLKWYQSNRALYELEDLSAYPLDELDDEGDSEEEDERTMHLTSLQRSHILEAIEVISNQYASKFFFWRNVGTMLTFLKYFIQEFSVLRWSHCSPHFEVYLLEILRAKSIFCNSFWAYDRLSSHDR